jgi:hypothetical protein
MRLTRLILTASPQRESAFSMCDRRPGDGRRGDLEVASICVTVLMFDRPRTVLQRFMLAATRVRER